MNIQIENRKSDKFTLETLSADGYGRNIRKTYPIKSYLLEHIEIFRLFRFKKDVDES